MAVSSSAQGVWFPRWAEVIEPAHAGCYENREMVRGVLADGHRPRPTIQFLFFRPVPGQPGPGQNGFLPGSSCPRSHPLLATPGCMIKCLWALTMPRAPCPHLFITDVPTRDNSIRAFPPNIRASHPLARASGAYTAVCGPYTAVSHPLARASGAYTAVCGP